MLLLGRTVLPLERTHPPWAQDIVKYMTEHTLPPDDHEAKKWLAGQSSTSLSTETFTGKATMESSYDVFLKSKVGYCCRIFMEAHPQVMLHQGHWQERFFARVFTGQRYFKTQSK